jgi:hypothetical protein
MSVIAAAVAVVAVGAGLGLAVSVGRHNARRARLRRSAAALTSAARREVLGLIDRAGADDGAPVLLLRPRPETAADPGSRLFGDPDLPPGEPWPKDASGAPARFLAQVRLHAPPLAPGWADRRVLLFAGAKGTVLARSALPCRAPPAPAPKGIPRGEAIPLGAVRLPHAAEAEDGRLPPFAPAALCRRVPAVGALLRRHGADPEGLLPYVLVPSIDTFELDPSHVSLMGGDPELVRAPHETRCFDCGRPLGFLLQLGDVLGLPGDAPVVYVYGCDAHPDRVEAFRDPR